MTKKPEKTSNLEFEQALVDQGFSFYVLKLYVTGMTPQSMRAIANAKKICEENLAGRYQLEVIDIYQQPDLAQDAQIVAAPTMIKQLPLPLRRIVGDLSNVERVLVGLNLQKAM